MNKYLVAIVLSFTMVTATAFAGIREFFTSEASNSIFPELTVADRLDMSDYYDAGQEHSIKDYYNGMAKIVKADSTHVSMQIGGSVVVDLFQLQDGDKLIYMAVETLELPQRDSAIKFYNTDGKPVKKTVLTQPVLGDWLTVFGKKNIKDVYRLIPFITAQARYNPATGMLTFRHTLDDSYADEHDKAFIAENLRTHVVYTWKNGKFILEK